MTSPRRLPARPGTLVAIDVAVAVATIAVSLLILSSDGADWPAGTRDPDGLAAALVVIINATITLRRRALGAALAIALVAGTVYAARQYPPIVAPALPLIVYLAATRLDDRRSRLVLIVAVAGSALGATLAAGPTDPQDVLIVAGCWLLGHYVRTRRRLVAELEQRAVDLERQREEQARRAVAEERLHIARELHDVLAHTMSVVAVQAGTGRLVGTAHPDEAINALATVETTARSAMQEMRHILTVLRADDDPDATVTPTPGLDDLPTLVAQVAEAGIAVALRVEGDPPPVPAGVGLAAYRITQEALTNVIKHAGPAHAAVLVRYTARDIALEVRDDGHSTAAAVAAGGHGLIGMRERAAVHGGELTAEPDPGGGFVVKSATPHPTGPDMTIRVVIADDQPLVRAGFATMVTYADDLELVGEADNGDVAIAVAKRTRPDVLLMDIRMPRLDGLEATRRITSDPELAAVRVIMLTTFDLDEYVYEALGSGASGFLLKDARPEDILNAVRVVAAGEALLAPSVTRRLIERFAHPPSTAHKAAELAQLTERETEVLVLIAQGRSNAEIAEELYISLFTAKTHVSRILTKLHARDRAQLVMVAYETGLITPGG